MSAIEEQSQRRGLVRRASALRVKYHAGCFLLIGFFLLSCFTDALAQGEPENRALHVEVFDMPSDAGGSIGLRWILGLREFNVPQTPSSPREWRELVWRIAIPEKEGSSYRILVSDQVDGEFKRVAEFPANTHYETDVSSPWWVWRKKRKDVHFFSVNSHSEIQLVNGQTYFLKIVLTDGTEAIESPVVSVIPQANLFNWAKLNNLLLLLAFAATVLVSIRRARINPNIFLRRIPGLDAVEEAVGRATEMGRPVLYLTGSGDLGGGSDPSSLATIAATVILGEVAKRVAAYGAELKVPHRAAIVMAICQEIVREAYFTAGRPDAYKEDTNFFITGDQFAYTAAVDGIILREQPAAHFFLGYYYAESLLLAETGATTGAIQIAGTDADHQLPFFITACDYTLIGEELYAASAYLSREPVLIGTLRGQDIGKGFLLVVMIIGTLLVTVGNIWEIPWLRILFQVFSDMK